MSRVFPYSIEGRVVLLAMNILFVSKYNQFRSKVAEAYFNKHNKLKGVHAKSAGVFQGNPTTIVVREVASRHRLSLKTSQSSLSTNLLEQQDLTLLVADDVPVSLFNKDNPYVGAFAQWKIPAAGSEIVEVEQLFAEIERRVQALLLELGQQKKKMDEVQRILYDLKDLSDEKTVAIWGRLGMPTKNYYGVSLSRLRQYAKDIGCNHKLALSLWKTNVHDARLLAAMIEDPKEVTENQIETWLRQADFWDITDKIATEVLSKTEFSFSKIKPWMRERNEYFRRTSWVLIDSYARRPEKIENSEFEDYLNQISKTINRETDWVKEAMLYALISIGKRNSQLHQKAINTATRLGVVKIDYGDTRCEAPNPLEKLSKVSFT